jgi:hypothetical protein
MLAHFPLAEPTSNPLSTLENRYFGTMLQQHLSTAQTGYTSTHNTNVRYFPHSSSKHGCRVTVRDGEVFMYAVGTLTYASTNGIGTISRLVSTVLIAYVAHGYRCGGIQTSNNETEVSYGNKTTNMYRHAIQNNKNTRAPINPSKTVRSGKKSNQRQAKVALTTGTNLVQQGLGTNM